MKNNPKNKTQNSWRIWMCHAVLDGGYGLYDSMHVLKSRTRRHPCGEGWLSGHFPSILGPSSLTARLSSGTDLHGYQPPQRHPGTTLHLIGKLDGNPHKRRRGLQDSFKKKITNDGPIITTEQRKCCALWAGKVPRITLQIVNFQTSSPTHSFTP